MSEGALFGNVVPNDHKVDYDKPGFCALCHIPIAEFNGTLPNGSPRIQTAPGGIPKWMPHFDPTKLALFKFDDGSTGHVVLCTPCREEMTPEDAQPLMESLINGWWWEVEHLIGERWTLKQRKAHMERYEHRHIIDRLDVPWGKSVLSKMKKPRPSRLKKIS